MSGVTAATVETADNDTGTSRRPRHELLMPALMLLGPLLHQLRSHGYPVARAEVLAIAAVVLGVGIAIGFVLHRGSLALRGALMVMLIVVACDLYVSGGTLDWIGIAVAAALAAVLLLRTHITTIAFTVSLALLASSLLPPVDPVEASTTSSSVVPGNPALPPVFHFVLDEHGGVEGLAGDTALVTEMTAWYARRGFRLFPKAYSPYVDTHNAIPNLLNLTASATDGSHLQYTPGAPPSLYRNAYFDRMRAQGYGLRVYQSDFLDFCGADTAVVISCFTYPANSISYAAGMTLPVTAHAGMLANHILMNQSWLFDRAVMQYQRDIRPTLAAMGAPAPARDWRGNRVTPSVPEILARVERDVARGAGGTVYFAHLLMPHYPYQYDASCAVHESSGERLDRSDPGAPAGMDNTPASRARRLTLYGEQVRCLMRQLDGFFARLDTLGVYASAVIVLNGDHGSRISIRSPKGDSTAVHLTRQDMLDGYSTLLAVKAPGVLPAPDTATVGIGEALSALVTSGFQSAVPASTLRPAPVVYLVNRRRGPLIPTFYRSTDRRPR